MKRISYVALIALALSCDSTGSTGNDVAAPTCTDGQKNGTESDIDCGGSCGACVVGKHCALAADCTSGTCITGSCMNPTCTDGVKNGGESDVDCGGSCGACADGKACANPADCMSSVCLAKTCTAPVCSDGVKNGSETDVDCGGGCPSCVAGLRCVQNSDCATGFVCDQTSSVCRNPTSCQELLSRRPGTLTGAYLLLPAGVTTPFLANCEMTKDGGGWTMVLKSNGDATLGYGSALWTDTNLLNPTDLSYSPGNAKFQGFLSVPGGELRGELDGYSFKLKLAQSQTAQAVFQGPASVSSPFSVALGTGANWSVQPNCQTFGVNTPYAYQRTRFGWTANQEADCNTNDTAIGLGLGATNTTAQDRGAGYACLSTNCSQGNVNTGGSGFLWVR